VALRRSGNQAVEIAHGCLLSDHKSSGTCSTKKLYRLKLALGLPQTLDKDKLSILGYDLAQSESAGLVELF
jgi:hypothetical protein